MEPIPAVAGPVEPLVASFEALYALERDPLVRRAVVLVDDPERAAEIVHDAFEKLYLRWNRVADPGAYLQRAVVNGCHSELRRRAVRRRRPAPSPDEVPPVEGSDDELLAALGRLRPRQRLAVTLRYYDDLPDEAIAALLGSRPATVRSLVSRGLAELRKEIRR